MGKRQKYDSECGLIEKSEKSILKTFGIVKNT